MAWPHTTWNLFVVAGSRNEDCLVTVITSQYAGRFAIRTPIHKGCVWVPLSYTPIHNGRVCVPCNVPLSPKEPTYEHSSETTNLFNAIEPCITVALPLPAAAGIPRLSHTLVWPAIRFPVRAASAEIYEASRGRDGFGATGFGALGFGGGLSW